MNKVLLSAFLLASFAVSSVNAGESVPYSADLADPSTGRISDGWRSICNSDSPWLYESPYQTNYTTPGTAAGLMAAWEPSSDADAMLISPAIVLNAGTTYTVGFWVKTKSNASSEFERFRLYMSPSGNSSDLKSGTVLIQRDDYINNDDFERVSETFVADVTGEFYFGIHKCSDYYQGNLVATGFFVIEGDKLPEEDPEEEMELPYVADFSTIKGFKEWSSLAGPSAEIKAPWNYNSYSKFAEFDAAYGVKEDNYFISPALKFANAGDYLITMEYTAHGSFDMMLGTDKTDYSSFDHILASYEDRTDFNEQCEIPFRVEQPGTYYVAMHVRADEGSFMGYRLHAFKIKNNLAVPVIVTDLSATADATDLVKTVLTWTNPSKNNDGSDINHLVSVIVNRNGEPIAELTENIAPGAAMTFVDEPGVAGSYKYSVQVYGDNGMLDAEPMTVEAGYVGHPVASFPYDFRSSSASQDEIDMFTIEDANSDGATWRFNGEYSWNRNFRSTNGEGATSADDYLASPYIHLTPGYYRLEFLLASQANNFEVGIATDRHDLAGTFTKLFEMSDVRESGARDYTVIVPIDVEGEYCLVWHHIGWSYELYYRDVALLDISLTDQAVLPGIVSGLDAVSEGKSTEVNISWINPSTDNAERPLESLSRAEVIRDGEIIATLTENLVPGESITYVDDTGKSGEYTYNVIVYNENGCSEQEAPSITLYAGEGLDVPYEAEFSDWNIVDYANTWYQWEVAKNGTVSFRQNAGPVNDGVYSPYLYLQEGYRYTVTFHTYNEYVDDVSDFELRAGKSPDRAVSIMAIKSEGSEEREYVLRLLATDDTDVVDEEEGIITVPTGNITFGFHVMSPTSVTVSDFHIEGDENNSVGRVESDGSVVFVGGKLVVDNTVDRVIISDVTGRVVYAGRPAGVIDFNEMGLKGIYIVRAGAAVLKVRN